MRLRGLSRYSRNVFILRVLSLTGTVVTRSLETTKSWKDDFFFLRKERFLLAPSAGNATHGVGEGMTAGPPSRVDRKQGGQKLVLSSLLRSHPGPQAVVWCTHLQGRPSFKF